MPPRSGAISAHARSQSEHQTQFKGEVREHVAWAYTGDLDSKQK